MARREQLFFYCPYCPQLVFDSAEQCKSHVRNNHPETFGPVSTGTPESTSSDTGSVSVQSPPSGRGKGRTDASPNGASPSASPQLRNGFSSPQSSFSSMDQLTGRRETIMKDIDDMEAGSPYSNGRRVNETHSRLPTGRMEARTKKRTHMSSVILLIVGVITIMIVSLAICSSMLPVNDSVDAPQGGMLERGVSKARELVSRASTPQSKTLAQDPASVNTPQKEEQKPARANHGPSSVKTPQTNAKDQKQVPSSAKSPQKEERKPVPPSKAPPSVQTPVANAQEALKRNLNQVASSVKTPQNENPSARRVGFNYSLQCKDVNEQGCSNVHCCPGGKGHPNCGGLDCKLNADGKTYTCEGKWMRENCPRSCGLCDCKDNPQSAEQCKISAPACCPGGTGDKSCGGLDCRLVGGSYVCLGSWMKENCPKSCGLCGRCSKPDMPNCKQSAHCCPGAKGGPDCGGLDCSLNKDKVTYTCPGSWMKDSCPRTCGMCWS